ncbi:MAG: hypothetical protein IKC49_02290 [Clostridia bacterium]|nr:hypothetical protein [Clostridia bacterium]
MTNETRELLYNKTAGEITTKERDYLDKIVIRNNITFQGKGIFLSALSAIILGNIGIAIVAKTFLLLSSLFATCIGLAFGLVMGGALYLSAPSLKRLGLTRKEWKELKKSKRIKKINEIVNEFNYNRRLEMHKTNDRLDEIVSKHTYRPINAEANVDNTEQVKEDKLSLIMKLTEKLSTEEKSTLITKLINQKDVSVESEISDDRVEETPREKDYLDSALEACLELNSKLDRDTFDFNN